MFKYIAFIAIALFLLPIEVRIQEVEANVTTFKPENNLKQHLENPVPLAVKKNYHFNGFKLVDREKEIECLSHNIYFEAAVESTAGKLAVAHVTHNRVTNKYFPNSYCEVVYQGKHHKNGFPKRNQCQFSWYCDGKHDSPYPGPTWAKVQEIAKYFYDNVGDLKDISDGAIYYHADYIPDPRWAKYKTKTVKIDTHIFYR